MIRRDILEGSGIIVLELQGDPKKLSPRPQEVMAAPGENLMSAPSNVNNLKNNWKRWLHFKKICASLSHSKQ